MLTINIDKITFKKSLMHLFASDLKLKTESTGEGFSGSSSIGYDAPAEITITGAKLLGNICLKIILLCE